MSQHLKALDGLTLSAEALAELCGVSRPTVYDWTNRQNMPRQGRGKFNAAACVQWVLSEKGGGAQSAADQRVELARAQTEKTQLQVMQMRGELVPREQMEEFAEYLTAQITEILDIVPSWSDDPRIRAELRERALDHRQLLERRLTNYQPSGPNGSEGIGPTG